MKKPLLIASLSTLFGLFMGVLGHHYYTPKHTVRVEIEPSGAGPAVTPRAEAEAQRAARPTPVVENNDPGCDKADEPAADASADAILTQAQTEFVNGAYKRAIVLARRVSHESPVRAWRIIGGAACHMKDLKLANESYRHLDAPGRQYMVYVCQREGIVNTRGYQFILAD